MPYKAGMFVPQTELSKVDCEIEGHFDGFGISVKRLIVKLSEGIDAKKEVFHDGVAIAEVPDREHQRWSWEKAARLLKMVNAFEAPKDYSYSSGGSLGAEEKMALIMRIKNLTVNFGDFGSNAARAVDTGVAATLTDGVKGEVEETIEDKD